MITLAELRKNKGITQIQLSKILRVSKSTIAMYESGYRTPTLKKAMEIAKFFNIPLEEISFSKNHVPRI